MRLRYNKYFNLLLSWLYTLTSITIFIILQIFACIGPSILGFLIFSISKKYDPSSIQPNLYVVGGFSTSIIMFINLLRCLKDAVRIPKQDNIADDIKILSLVEKVADDVGVSRFEAVYLNSGLDISTFYIGRGRYLNLSVIALTYLTEEELKAVIAHECGHHHHNAMLINRSYYRSFLFFESFVKALTETISTIQRRAKEISFLMFFYVYSPIALYGILPSLYIYDLFLSFMRILIRNSEYEYYCDWVAAKYSGGNILASALHKVFDLHIAYNIISKGYINNEYKIIPNLNLNNIEKLYVENMNREFLNVRCLNPKERSEAAAKKTDTHPSLLSRIEKAQPLVLKLIYLNLYFLNQKQFYG